MLYKYTWPYPVTYMDIVIPGEGSLVASPGDVREFDTPPDYKWTALPAPKPAVAEQDQAPVAAKKGDK